MQTKADSDKTALTSIYSHEHHYLLFDNLFIGIGQKNMDRILSTISPSIKWFFIKDGQAHHLVINTEGFKSHMGDFLSKTDNYTAKIHTVGWDPILQQGYVYNTYEHKAMEGKSKRVYEIILFKLKGGLISEYLPIEHVIKEW